MPWIKNKRTGETVFVPDQGPPADPTFPYKGEGAALDNAGKRASIQNDAEKLAIENERLKLEKEKADQEAALKARELEYTPAQKAADEAFGKEYADWNAGGGFSSVDGQLRLLENQIPRLENSDTISGGVMGRLPDFARQAINPESISTQQNVEKSIQATLRQTLGAQYTQQEGENLLRRTYDPRLSEEENAARIRATVAELRARANAKNDSAGYYERNGTIRGWTPPPTNAPTADYSREMAAQREAFLARHKDRPDAAEIWRKFAEPAGRASLARRINAPRKRQSRVIDFNDLP